MIRRQSTSHLGRTTGAGLMVGYIIVFLLVVWNYLKIVITSPGYARDSIPRSSPPAATDYIPYQFPVHPPKPSVQFDAGPDPSQLAPVANIANAAMTHLHAQSSSTTLAASSIPLAGDLYQVLSICLGGAASARLSNPIGHIIAVTAGHVFCSLIFFINFTSWASIYWFYVLITLIVVAARTSNSDGQIIALIAVSALFGLFSALMLSTHINLILTGKTTVESFKARDQQEQEDRILQKEYGYFWHNQEKRKVRRRWKEEWGGSPVDARWRHGSSRHMWEQEMGKGWLGWICRPLGDGLHFRSNPHFGPHGEWLMKKDWPRGK
ncbi:hypothetical protein IAR55_005475 [Kwoniella newhampshirensis]|uniref:Palmitoyltransferase n=1 Tax=Kwoniella newhampshirensis TaxID=1651941 RepID=A0AAW0YKZ6_9TREE